MSPAASVPCLLLGSLALLLPALPGCGSGSGGSGPATQDAAIDSAAPAADSGDDGPCFPFCGTGSSSGGGGGDSGGAADASSDGPLSCAQLKARYQGLEGPAQACNPQLPSQCAATTNDPCCPVTVTASNVQAVSAFDQAVAEYQAACTADCSMRICQPAPSNQCDPTGTSTGLCH